MLPASLKKSVEETLSEKFNSSINIVSQNAIGGGCINSAHRIETNKGSYFLKWNDAGASPGMFEAEARFGASS